jgi:hypothetical protein
MNLGLFCRMSAIGSVSGGGKTTVIVAASLPHLLPKQISGDEYDERCAERMSSVERREFLREQKAQRKVEKQARREAEKEGLPVPEDPPKDTSKPKTNEADASYGRSVKPEKIAEEKEALKARQAVKMKEPGRITAVAVHNEAVDALTETHKAIIPKFRTAAGLCRPRSVIRLHSEGAEVTASLAMLMPGFDVDRPSQSQPFLIDHLDRVKPNLMGPVNRDLFKDFLSSWSENKYSGIKDPRFVLIRDSSAYYIMMLAQIPGFPMSDALTALGPVKLANFAH